MTGAFCVMTLWRPKPKPPFAEPPAEAKVHARPGRASPRKPSPPSLVPPRPTGAILQLDTIDKLPLWAQVLIASRLARRAILALPLDVPASVSEVLIPACDAMDRCAERGEYLADQRPIIAHAANYQPTSATHAVSTALYYAADAAHAAHDSLDFSAAESACESSVAKALAAAAQSPGMSALQAATYVAADLDLLRFNCETFAIRRYHGVGAEVMQRLHPVHPLRDSERLKHSPGPMDDDPTGGSR